VGQAGGLSPDSKQLLQLRLRVCGKDRINSLGQEPSFTRASAHLEHRAFGFVPKISLDCCGPNGLERRIGNFTDASTNWRKTRTFTNNISVARHVRCTGVFSASSAKYDPRPPALFDIPSSLQNSASSKQRLAARFTGQGVSTAPKNQGR